MFGNFKLMPTLQGALFILLTTSIGFAEPNYGIRPVNLICHSWERVMDAAVQDDYAYLATGQSGLAIVDISDPSAPEEIGFLDTDGIAKNVIVDGETVFLVESDNLRIVDVHDPNHPTEIWSYEISGGLTMDLVKVGNIIYLTEGDLGLAIIDVHNPDDPVCLSTIDTHGCATGITISDNLALISVDRFGLDVIDISDPEFPQEVGFYDSLTYSHDVDVMGDYAVLVGAQPTISILNISDPENPHVVGITEDLNYGAVGVCIIDSMAIVACNNRGYFTIDLSDVTNPTVIGSCLDILCPVKITKVSSDYILTSEYEDGISIIDVSDPTEPVVAGHHNTLGNAFGVVVQDGIAYIANYDSGIKIMDVSDPQQPILLSILEAPETIRTVTVDGDYIYFGGSRLYIADVSDPCEPITICSHINLYRIDEIIIQDDLAFIAGAYGTSIYDISDKTEPDWVCFIECSNESFSNFVLGPILCVTDGPEFRIFVISDPTEPVLLYSYSLEGEAFRDAVMLGDQVFLVTRDGLLISLDISDLQNVQELCQIPLRNECSKIERYGEHLFISTMDGIQVFDINDPSEPIEVGYYNTPGITRVIFVEESLLYVADFTNLGIYDCSEAMGIPPALNPLHPKNISLSTPYPNPFNSTTTIGYSLPAAGMARVAVYDLSGREVARLADGVKSAGNHEVVWTADGVSSGVYLVKLTASEKTAMSKVVLVK